MANTTKSGPLKTEPALTFGVVAAVIVTLASALGIVIDFNTVNTIIVAAVPVIAAILTRFHVTPTG